jgi:5-methylcytosine-specific restriction enzyme subunit McrC
MRQPPARRHMFALRHDVFLPDNAENRLLKSALLIVCSYTRHSTTWRDAHELAGLFASIPACANVAQDMRSWRNTRLMSHYRAVRPWCELVLGQQMPVALSGVTQGLSLLFPMERLFERYVEHHLQARMIGTGYHIKRQAASQYLCKLGKRAMFLLKPDMLLKKGEKVCMVLDAKWKLLSSQAQSNKYGLQQSDFYQMFAYGHKYLSGMGEMMLIYPKTTAFAGKLDRFEYAPDLGLWAVGFDLERDEIEFPPACTLLDQLKPYYA